MAWSVASIRAKGGKKVSLKHREAMIQQLTREKEFKRCLEGRLDVA